MKPREVTRAIEKKTPGTSGAGKEENRWIVLDGKKVLRVTYPKVHGQADIATGTLHSIRKQLRLDPHDFQRFVDCKMSGPDYITHLRRVLADGA